MTTSHYPLYSLLAATVLASALHADTTKSLDAVSVTASEISERDDLKSDSVTNLYRVESTARSGTEIFTRKEIDAYAPKDLFDLLDKAAGMNLTYQGRRNPYSIEERGGSNLGNEHYSTKYVTGLYPDRGRTIGLELSLAF